MADRATVTDDDDETRMGEDAVYVGVDEDQLERLLDTDPADLAAAVRALQASAAPSFALGAMWDGLHFVLAGGSADSPIEGDPLSEAIVGVHVFDAPDFIGCTEHDELDPVLGALEAVDIAAAVSATSFPDLDRAGIFPYDWSEYNDERHEAMIAGFTGLVGFLRGCREGGRHVIAAILDPA